MISSKKKKKKVLIAALASVIISLAVIGSITFLLRSNSTQKSSKEKNEENKQELKKYLLQKRLELKRYFVFNLGKEVEPGNYSLSEKQTANTLFIRRMNSSLSADLTKLLGAKKDLIIFGGVNKDTPSLEWTHNKLDQKIKEGNETYIFFDKTKINASDCNFFRKETNFPGAFTLAILAEPEVLVLTGKEKSIKFLQKNDPLLNGEELKNDNPSPMPTDPPKPVLPYSPPTPTLPPDPIIPPKENLKPESDNSNKGETNFKKLNEKVVWSASQGSANWRNNLSGKGRDDYYLFTTVGGKLMERFAYYINKKHPIFKGKKTMHDAFFTFSAERKNVSGETSFREWFFDEDNNNFTLIPLEDWPNQDSNKSKEEETQVKVLVRFEKCKEWVHHSNNVTYYEYEFSDKQQNTYYIQERYQESRHPTIVKLEEKGLMKEGKNFYLRYDKEKVEEVYRRGDGSFQRNFWSYDNSIDLEVAE